MMILKAWNATFGGGSGNKRKKLLGLLGKRCANPNLKGVWVSKIFMLSIWPC